MPIGGELLMRGLGGLYTPQNAIAYNPDTQTFKYADGSTGATPVKQPGLLARAFSPEAGQVIAENQQYALAPYVASRQALATRGAAEQVYGQNDQDYAAFGDRPVTAEERNNQAANLAFGNNGGRELLANRIHNTVSAETEEAANRARQAATSGLLGNPEAAAGTENLGLQYQSGEYGGNLALQPQKFYSAGLGLGNDITQQQQLKEQLPYRGLTGMSTAQREAGLSTAELGNLPYDIRTMQNTAVGNAAESGYRAPGMPIAEQINGPAGTVTPNVRNPMGFYSGYQGMGAMGGLNNIPGMGSGTQTVTAPSGAQYVIPSATRQPINVLGNNQLQTTPSTTNAPANQSTTRPPVSPVTMGSTLGGSDEEKATKSPAKTKAQALSELGFEIDRLGHLQLKKSGWQNGVVYGTPQYQHNLALAMRIANAQNIQ